MALSGDAQAVYQDPTPAWMYDTDSRLKGDAQGLVKNPDYIPQTYYNTIEAAALPSTFASQNAIGTQEYSKDLSGYLNALSPNQLLSLGDDFNISGLARTDLSQINPYAGGGTTGYYPVVGFTGGSGDLAYSPEQLRTISKYRNTGMMGGGGYSELGNIHGVRYQVDDAYDDTGYNTAGLWNTRNFQDGIDDLYRYDDGDFVRAHTNEYGHAGTGYVKPAAMAIASAILSAGAGAALGGAGGAVGGSGASTVGTGSGLGMGGTATGTAGGLGSSTSLISGAGSLNLGAGSGFAGAAGAGGAGLGSTASLIGGAGSLGLTGGMGGAGANALLSSPNFSLIEGAGSLNLGLADRYALPEDLQSLDMDEWKRDLAQKAIKKGVDYFTRGDAPQPGSIPIGGGGGSQGGGYAPSEYDMANAIGYTPYQIANRPNTLGYIDRLRSQ